MNEKTENLIHHFLERSCRDFPDKTALVHEDVRATYSDINVSADHLACWFLEQKVLKGERVALIMENGLEYVVGYYAALKAGLVVAPLSYELKPDGLRPLLKELEPSLLIVSTRCERVVHATNLEDLGIKAIIINKPKLDWRAFKIAVYSWEDVSYGQCDETAPALEIQETDLASIIYTSGSTGRSKGVMLSHENIVSNTDSICRYLCLGKDDIQMVVLPFFYVMGKSLLNTHFAVGGTVVINNKFAFPADVIKQMAEENVTGFSGVPSTYAYLLNRSPLAASKDKLACLRYCTQAGGHMSRQLKKELRLALPEETRIYIMYGATEASARLTYLAPESFERKMDSIGKAIPGVTLRILDEQGAEVPQGEVGELVADGINIMRGYWRDPETTKKVLDQSGYHTGDLCYQDEEGFYFLKGRRDHLLKVGGHRINPQEIEDVLMETGLLVEAAVIGIEDRFLGHKPAAFVTPKDDGVNESRLIEICSMKLPKYKWPSMIRLVRSIPKNANGKIDNARLLELLTE
ncbi:MAG: AMP-dependent synthetase [Desulfobacteraceae bacterium]|nr:MAG: AMP-dependent synthetase [Desulfobacteraceae bacterium]